MATRPRKHYTVVEDCEDAELQKITEGPVSVINEELVVYSDMFQGVTHTKDLYI